MRAPSPDGKVDALLVEREPGFLGATVATPMLVYIVKAGAPADEDKLVLQGDNFDDLNIKWLEPKLLAITYKKGRIFKFTNFWEEQTSDKEIYVVEVQLRPTSSRSLD